MRRRVLASVVVCVALVGVSATWWSSRGDDKGTMHAAGVGDLTGVAGGYVTRKWSVTSGVNAFTAGQGTPVDVDGDGTSEILGVAGARVVLWNAAGEVLGSSAGLAGAQISGVYDLDGDGVAAEVVVVVGAVGGGVFVLDLNGLGTLWRSDDPGFNGGGALKELLVDDLDADGLPDIAWNTSFLQNKTFEVVSFPYGMSAPRVVRVDVLGVYDNYLPPMLARLDGPAQPATLVVPQSKTLSLVDVTSSVNAQAVCSADGSLCLDATVNLPDLFPSHAFGVQYAVDVDADGAEELVFAASDDRFQVSLSLVSPRAAEPLRWQYVYGVASGNTPPAAMTTSTRAATDGLVSSVGEGLVAASVYNDTDQEVDATGAPLDDCLDLPDAWGALILDGASGLPLGSWPNARVAASADLDGDQTPELIVQELDGAGLPTDVVGLQLECGGPHAAGFTDCADTGCLVTERWRVPGELPLFDEPSTAGLSVFSNTFAVTPALMDVDGDGLAEVITQDGLDWTAWGVDSAGRGVVVASYQSAVPQRAVRFNAAHDALLLEEDAATRRDQMTVLGAGLSVNAQVTVPGKSGGAGLALGRLAGGAPVLGAGSSVFMDLTGDRVRQDLGDDSVVLFSDLDNDGQDELVAVQAGDSVGTSASAGWSVAVYRWLGSAWRLTWRASDADLGFDTHGLWRGFERNHVRTGDFDGDGDQDLVLLTYGHNLTTAARTGDYLTFLDGAGDGQGGPLLLAPPISAPNGGAARRPHAQLLVGDLCGAAGCPGTDGKDDVLMAFGRSIERYDLTGFRDSFPAVMDWTADLMLADFDGDGADELFAARMLSSQSSKFLGMYDLDGTELWRGSPPSPAGALNVRCAADVSGDGVMDVVTGGGYGQLFAYAGDTGAEFLDATGAPLFPVYLADGALLSSPPLHASRSRRLVGADIDGDGHDEVIVANDDGWVYAVDMVSDGGPALLWSTPFASVAVDLAAADIDDDGLLEVIVTTGDGQVTVLEGGAAQVVIAAPQAETCWESSTFEISGTAVGATAVEVKLGAAVLGTAAVDAITGEWAVTGLPWDGQGARQVWVRALNDSSVVSTTSVIVTHWQDDDGDGYSECSAVDCNDDPADPTAVDTYLGADELCDGADNDCDGLIPANEGDADGDGHLACDDDCDDATASTYAGAPELVNGVDDDCDGVVDNGTAAYDDDGDGFTEDGGDCDDAAAARSPAAVEAPNGVDDDCDGVVDNGTAAYDDDGDGVSEDGGDCDDTDDAVHPGALDPVNGVDDDCDGVVDNGSAVADDDGDGFSEAAGDCDDANTDTYPGAVEVPDTADNDCDGLVDEGTVAFDDDGDGFSEADGDCDDANAAAAPGRPDGCTPDGLDAVDNNCDGIVDDECVEDTGMANRSGGGCNSLGGQGGLSLGAALLSLLAVRRRRGVGLAAAALVAGGCTTDIAVGSQPGQAVLQRDVEVLDVGRVTLGETGVATVELHNTGDAAISITRVTLTPEGTFSLPTDLVGSEIGANNSAGAEFFPIEVQFTPTASGVVSGTLSLDLSDTTLTSLEIPLVAVGDAAMMLAAPSALDLGHSATMRSQTVDLLNESAAPVTVVGVSGVSAPLVVTPDLTDTVLAAGSLTTVTLSVDGADAVNTEVVWTTTTGGAVSSENTVAVRVFANTCDSASPVLDGDGDGWTACGGDCNDDDPLVHPGVVELANGTDDNCNDTVDEGTRQFDDDGDGATEDGGDCWDASAAVHPGADEVLDNGIDDNCDGCVDLTAAACAAR